MFHVIVIRHTFFCLGGEKWHPMKKTFNYALYANMQKTSSKQQITSNQNE